MRLKEPVKLTYVVGGKVLNQYVRDPQIWLESIQERCHSPKTAGRRAKAHDGKAGLYIVHHVRGLTPSVMEH